MFIGANGVDQANKLNAQQCVQGANGANEANRNGAQQGTLLDKVFNVLMVLRHIRVMFYLAIGMSIR